MGVQTVALLDFFWRPEGVITTADHKRNFKNHYHLFNFLQFGSI